jgi:hypothetical protein
LSASISLDFENAYCPVAIDDSYMKANPWFIHSFYALGLDDPFYDESSLFDSENDCRDPKKPFKMEENIYPDSRYCAEHSPLILYIPSKNLMIKMMRACFDC